MERADRAPLATFYAPGDWGARVELPESAAHHAGVKRLAVGDAVRLSSGDGRRAGGTIAELAKRRLSVAVDIESLERMPARPHIELWAPVGDRERMLMLAEKAVELGASAWRPVVYHRSRSVSPRGEGEAFREKVRLRMTSALEQSGSAWLPAMHDELSLELALRAWDEVAGEAHGAARGGARGGAHGAAHGAAHDAAHDAAHGAAHGVLLDLSGVPLLALRNSLTAPIAIALGPEGGLEPAERELFLAARWRTASLGANVLRFETAGIAALALVRSFTP